MESDDAILEIIIGTYENYVIGYILETQNDKFKLRPSFATEDHLQCVKCLASSNKFVASGSTDETIKLYNMKTRKQIGALVHHNGTITSLGFHDSFLFSSSEDSTICIWSTNNWQCLKTLRGHKKAINCISIHPSGKMALSISKDKCLRTWNLINGRSAFATNIKKVADIVRWSPDGTEFLVACNKTIDVYSVEGASITKTIDFESKICDFTFFKNDILIVGGEKEDVLFYELKSGNLLHTTNVGGTRVKALQCVSVIDETFLVTATSDGCVKVWHVNKSEDNFKVKKIGKVKTDYRITCMTVYA